MSIRFQLADALWQYLPACHPVMLLENRAVRRCEHVAKLPPGSLLLNIERYSGMAAKQLLFVKCRWAIPLLNWIERRALILTAISMIAVFGLGFAYSNNSLLLRFFDDVFLKIFSNAHHAYQADIFPANVRPATIGSTYSFSRLVSGVLPFMLLPVLSDHDAGAMFGVIATALLVAAVSLSPRATVRTILTRPDTTTTLFTMTF